MSSLVYTIFIFYLQLVNINSSVQIGETCCGDQWDKIMKPFITMLKKLPYDLSSPLFIDAFNKWNSSLLQYVSGEGDISDGLCEGRLSFRCEYDKCICNDEAPLHFEEDGKDCVADEEDICFNYLDAMKCGPGLECIKNPTNTTGPFDYCIYPIITDGPSTPSRPPPPSTLPASTTRPPNTTEEEPVTEEDCGSLKITGYNLFILILFIASVHYSMYL